MPVSTLTFVPGSLEFSTTRSAFAIQFNQVVALRKRWLIQSFVHKDYGGAFWGAASAAESYGVNRGYSKALARDVIGQIRTDLDRFSEAEQCVLENHGYLLADAAITTHAPTLITVPQAPLTITYPEWMDEDKVRDALKDSARMKVFGH